MRHKIQLYILSLWLLFLLLGIQQFNSLTWSSSVEWYLNVWENVKGNGITAACIFFLVLGVVFYWDFKYVIKGGSGLPMQISKIENQNYEHLTFLTTYIIPFICFELEVLRNVLILVLLLVTIGAIYVKTHLFYANPTLALLGYHVYRVETLTKKNLIFISRTTLKEGDSVSHLHLGDHIYFVKP